MACSCNWTSYFRGDEDKVPAVEKYKDDSHTNPQTLEELAAFGKTLQTGDILICHCTHSFGKLAQLGTFSPFDHVAMIVKCDNKQDVNARMELIKDKPQPADDDVMPTWPKPGLERTEVFEAMGGGVFSYPFTAWAVARGNFCKYTAVRRLRNIKTGDPINEEQQRLIELFVREFWGRPYEEGNKGMMELARPVIRMRNPSVTKKRDKSLEALDNLFCSELVTEALQRANILPEDTLNSNEILPSMFGPNKAVDKYLQVQNHGFRLGEVEVFKAPQTPLNEAIKTQREKKGGIEHIMLSEDEKDELKPNPLFVQESSEHEKEESEPQPAK